MKKIISCIIILAFVFSLVACSSEAVPFSEKLMNKKDCYIDVVEILPQSSVNDVVFLYCKCTLADGSMVWMEISAEEYVEYFDSEASVDDINATARKITYNNPVRLNGAAVKRNNVNIDTPPKRYFNFDEADKALTLEAGTRTSPEVEYTEVIAKNTLVYADITHIESKIAVSVFSSSPDSVMCECKTAAGETVWLFISVNDYHEYLDKTAHFSTDPINSSNASVLDFVEPVRFHGITISPSDKVNTTYSSVATPSQLIEFKEVDKEQVEKAKLSNQEPVKYSSDSAMNQPIYIDISQITPQYAQYVAYNIPSALICQCQTIDGENVWIQISIANYKEHFFDDYADNMQVTKTLSNAKRVVGKIIEADSIDILLADKISQDTIVQINDVTNPE